MTTTEPDQADSIETTATEPDPLPDPEVATAVELAPVAPAQAMSTRMVVGTDLPVVPAANEIDALAQFAVTLAGSGTAPRALQGKPNDCFMVLLTARDLGVALTTAVREFHVIDGKVTLSPKVKLAMVRQQGHGKVYPHQAPRMVVVDGELREQRCPCGTDDPANDDQRATWHAERADEPGILHTSTFTMAMAARVPAKENQRAITLAEKSTWRAFPQRMLSWRSLGYLLDDVFSEVGTGLYSPDELGAVTDEDGVPVIDVVGRAEPVRGTTAPRGHNQPPPPPEPVATAEQLAPLRERIAALSVLPAARDALVALWTRPRSDDSSDPTLPPIQHLKVKQVKIAEAMVASIEQRAKAGEWGTIEPETPQDDEPPATTSGDEPAADDATVAPDDDQPGPDAVTAVVIAEVKSMEPETVDEQLANRKLDTAGRLDTRRRRLAEAMIAERQQQS